MKRAAEQALAASSGRESLRRHSALFCSKGWQPGPRSAQAPDGGRAARMVGGRRGEQAHHAGVLAGLALALEERGESAVVERQRHLEPAPQERAPCALSSRHIGRRVGQLREDATRPP